MSHSSNGPEAVHIPQQVTSQEAPGEVIDLTQQPEVIDLSANEEKVVADAWKREEAGNREADEYNKFFYPKEYGPYKPVDKL